MSSRRIGPRRTGASRSRVALVHVAIAVLAVIAMAGTAAAFWAASGTGSGFVGAATLTKPTAVTAAAVDYHTVNVSWTASPTTVPNMAYKVVRVGATSAVVCQTAATSCTDAAAQASTTYTYTVEAVIGAWTSGTTSSPSVTTPAEPVKSLTFTSAGSPTCPGGSLTLASGVTSWTSSVTRTNSTGTLAITLSAPAGTITPASVSVATGNNESGAFTISGLPTGTTTVTASATAHTSATCNVTVSAPAFTPTSLSTTSDADRRAESDELIVIGFSAPVSPASICANWNGTTTLSGNPGIIVRFNDGVTSNDSISFLTSNDFCGTGTGTTINIGSIDLGSTSYVTGPVNFSGNGSNATTLSLSGTTLTIKLGGNGVTTSQATASPTAKATYTPDPSLKSTGNVAVSGTVQSSGLLF